MARRPADTANLNGWCRPASLILAALVGGVSAAAAQPAAPAQTVQPLPVHEASGILGRSVHAPDGQDIGRIVDVLVDQNGNPRAAVIDFGGYMGIGNRKIAVDWSALKFAPGDADNPVTLQMSLNDLKAAPRYRENGDKAPDVVAPTTAGK